MTDVDVMSKVDRSLNIKEAVSGEIHHAWFVSIPSAGGAVKGGAVNEVALPEWVTDGIDSTISKWVTENDKWDAEVSERLSKGKVLTHKKKLLHDAFVSSNARRCPIRASVGF